MQRKKARDTQQKLEQQQTAVQAPSNTAQQVV